MNSLPLNVTNVNIGVGIETARLYGWFFGPLLVSSSLNSHHSGTPEAVETSAQDYATYKAFETIQSYNVMQAAPAIYEKMPYLPKGTIEASLPNFINTVVIGKPLVMPDGTPTPPYRIDEKSGRQ